MRNPSSFLYLTRSENYRRRGRSSGYEMEVGSLWLRDKFWTIAVIWIRNLSFLRPAFHKLLIHRILEKVSPLSAFADNSSFYLFPKVSLGTSFFTQS
jgi:hypothetical protein